MTRAPVEPGRTMTGPVCVIVGPVALRVGRYWVGVASGDVFSAKRRRTPEAALADAARMELGLSAAGAEEE